MKIDIPVPGIPADASFPGPVLPVAACGVILAALVLLPGPALFLAILACVVGLGVNLAGVHRQGGPDVPRVPLGHED